MSSLIRVNIPELKVSQRILACDISFSVEAGEVVSIVGENGAGKSRLLHHISAANGRTNEVWLSGRDAAQLSPAESASMRAFIEQNGHPVFPAPVGYLLHTLAEHFHVSEERQKRIIERLDVEQLRQSRSDRISGGEWARVKLAMGLLQTQELLIADEADAALDTNWRTILFDLEEFVQGILLVTHNRKLALDRASKVLELQPAGLKRLK